MAQIAQTSSQRTRTTPRTKSRYEPTSKSSHLEHSCIEMQIFHELDARIWLHRRKTKGLNAFHIVQSLVSAYISLSSQCVSSDSVFFLQEVNLA